MQLQFPSLLWPLFFSVTISLTLAYIVWRRETNRQSLPVLIFLLGIAQWSASSSGTLMSTHLDAQVFFSSFKYIGVTTTVTAFWAFAVTYTGREHWLTRRTIALLLVEPVIVLVAVATNPLHGLMWPEHYPIMVDQFSMFDSDHGPFFWLHAGYAYVLLIFASGLLITYLIRSRHLIRSQVGTVLIGVAAPWVTNLLFLTGNNPVSYFDLTPLSFTITGIVAAWSLTRFHLFDLVPVARSTVIERMPDGMLVLDEQDRLVDANPAFARLIETRDIGTLISKPVSEWLPESMQGLFADFQSKPGHSGALTISNETGERFYDVQIQALTDQQGKPSGRLVMIRNVTELRRAMQQVREQNDTLTITNQQLMVAREEAVQANRLKSEFLATMSHELRTPLNAIIGYTDLMLVGVSGEVSDKQHAYLQRIMSNGEHLLTLINNLLDISRIEAGRMEVQAQPFSPVQALRNTADRMQSIADQQGLNLETTLDPALPDQLIGDISRIEQILINLLGNALKFTEEGEVRVALRRVDDATWSMQVSDTGIGIPPEAQRYIFDEFRQVDGSTSREYGGSGLGLAIVRRLVDMMDGTVTVTSKENEGSTFTVQLPLLVPDEASQDEPADMPQHRVTQGQQ